MQALKLVFHVHTDYSDDCDAPVESILENARQTGINCVTITDHDTIEGALALAELAGSDLQVIVGEEVTTSEGHLIGLFLRKPVPPGLSARRTAELIHAQGGLVVAPHPFIRISGWALGEKMYELADVIDAVEVFNAQTTLPLPNRRAEEFARQFRLPALVGVDMHQRGHLNVCYQWVRPFDGPRPFLAALRQAHFVRARHTLGYFIISAFGMARRMSGIGLPARYGRNCPRIRRRVMDARGRMRVADEPA
jgi:hypothetical protein